MEDQRKHAIPFAATLLCARKLIETIESDKPNLAKQSFMDKAIQETEFILERINKRWPAEGVNEQWGEAAGQRNVAIERDLE